MAPSKEVSSFARWIGAAALAIWALLEIFKGANYFRRGLGVVVLLVTVVSVLLMLA